MKILPPYHYYIRNGEVRLKAGASTAAILRAFAEKTVYNHTGKASLSIRDGDLYCYGTLLAKHYWFGVIANAESTSFCCRLHACRVWSAVRGRTHWGDPRSLYESLKYHVHKVHDSIRRLGSRRSRPHKRSYQHIQWNIDYHSAQLRKFASAAGLPVQPHDPKEWAFSCLDYGERVRFCWRLKAVRAAQLAAMLREKA